MATTSKEQSKNIEEDRDSGICSMRFVDCLASCLSSVESGSDGESELIELAATSATEPSNLPFLRRSLFSNIAPTVAFYPKGSKVRRPNSKQSSKLTWCQNSLLPTVIRNILAASHIKIVDESKSWFGYWGRHLKSSQYKRLKPYQKVNHYPGAFHLGRKDRLWQHLKEMEEEWGNGDFRIMPLTFVLPKESRRLKAYLSNQTPMRRMILKPPASARGSGISIVSKYSQIPAKTPLVAQDYVENPLLINGSKFDLRLYVYVTSLDPLRVYLYREGLVRFASAPYCTSPSSLSNHFVHLTNFSINKGNQVSKWKLSEFWTHLEEEGHDWRKLHKDIKDIALKAVLACEQHIRDHATQHSDFPFISHELFGMDVLVDSQLRAWLIEMNISPSLHSATPLDINVKAPLARDVLNLCGLFYPVHGTPQEFFDSLEYRTKHFHRHRSVEHMEKEELHLSYFQENEEIAEDIVEGLTDADIRCLVEVEDELARRGNFELLYPLGETTLQYLAYMKRPTYFNLLLTQWQALQAENRAKGIAVLEKHCVNRLHFASTMPAAHGSDEAGTPEPKSGNDTEEGDSEPEVSVTLLTPRTL